MILSFDNRGITIKNFPFLLTLLVSNFQQTYQTTKYIASGGILTYRF